MILSISSNQYLTMATVQMRKKVKLQSVAYLKVKWKDNPEPKAFKMSDLQKSLVRVEREILTKNNNRWSWAILYTRNNEIIHYYHPTSGTAAISKDEYSNKLKKSRTLSGYIIYNTAWRRKNPNKKSARTVRLNDPKEVTEFFNEDVLRIDIYQDGKKIDSYYGK